MCTDTWKSKDKPTKLTTLIFRTIAIDEIAVTFTLCYLIFFKKYTFCTLA